MSGRALVASAFIVALAPFIAVGATPAADKTKAKPAPKVVKAAKVSKTIPADKPPKDTKPPESVKPVVHEVGKGETLTVIAKKYKVTIASIVIANKLRGPRARLTLGQRLKIPRPGVAPTFRPRGPIDEPLPVSLVLSLPEFEEPPSFQWPIAGPVTSTFGRRSHSWHRGIDILADRGTPIVASAPGVVIASGFEARYGQMVKIEHDGGFVTVYAHNERNLVEEGQDVKAGQVIGLVGRTGRATAEHVHFEIRYEGRVYNPLYLLPLPPRSVQVDLGTTEPHEDDE